MTWMRTALVAMGAALAAGCVVTARNAGRGTRVTEAGWATAPAKPPATPSDEATADQLQLAREQGQATDAAVAWWSARGSFSAAQMGAGEYEVTCALRVPDGTWSPGGAGLEWRADGGTAVIAVVVQDGADRRVVPGLEVTARIWDAAGKPIAAVPLHYLWAVPVEAYTAPATLPAGLLRIRIEIDPPDYWRHDPINGDRFARSAFAEFTGLRLGAQAPSSSSADTAAAVHLGAAQGAALARAYDEMSRAVANSGAQMTTAGDYRIGYAVEYAETYWQMQGHDLTYNMRPEESAETNAHVEIAVFDALTGRLLPGLAVRVTMLDREGRPVGTAPVPFMWHPWIHHYGANWRVPCGGTYRLQVHVDPPAWARADRQLGHRFAQPIDVVFDDVRIFTGQK